MAFGNVLVFEFNCLFYFMKFIKAILNPFKIEAAKEALLEIGIEGLTVTQVKGFACETSHAENDSGSEYTLERVPKIMLELAVNHDEVSKVVETIANAARTGKMGDGKIFILPVEDAILIRAAAL